MEAALTSLLTHQRLGQNLLNHPSHPVPTQALFKRAPQNRHNVPQACALDRTGSAPDVAMGGG
eukprot:2416447-Pleurochrysis_carterae.AAC.2